MSITIQSIFKNSFKDPKGHFIDELTTEDINLIFENKLFKCYLPESLGGLGLSLPETLQIIEDASFINGSLGWLIQIGNGGMYFVTNFKESTARSLFTSPDAVVAGSGTSNCIAERVSDGYLVSGKWKYCSGSAYATLFTVTFTAGDTGEVLSGIVPANSVIVLNDWDTLGMRNTSTNTIELVNVLIPYEYVFKVTERKSFLNEPVLGLPFILYAQAFFIHVVFGTFRRMLAEAEKMMDEKGEQMKALQPDRYHKMLLLLEEGAKLLQDSHKEIELIVQKIVDRPESLNPSLELDYQQTFMRRAKEIRSNAHELYAAMGMDVLYRSHPIAVFYADLIMVSQHKLLNG